MAHLGLGYDDRDFEASAFEVLCRRCSGGGEDWDTAGNPTPCLECKGAGTVPTTHGAELLAFLKRHYQTKED